MPEALTRRREGRKRHAQRRREAAASAAVAYLTRRLPTYELLDEAALERIEATADTILAEVRNHLLLEMSSAMLDVDAVAGGIDADLDPREVQAKIEGRHPMTLAEYARLHHFIASRT